jgi:hypothetical protein
MYFLDIMLIWHPEFVKTCVSAYFFILILKLFTCVEIKFKI